MIWQSVLNVIDAIESWVAGQSYWVQVILLLAVLGPLCYLLAGLIDRAVEAVLAWHSKDDRGGDDRSAAGPAGDDAGDDAAVGAPSAGSAGSAR